MGKLILLNIGIGNVEDISPKVRKFLREGISFVVEDTRKFKDLLERLGIDRREGRWIQSFHDHSNPKKIEKIISLLDGGDVFVLSDRGSPIISDPALPLVRAALAKGREVDSASGVSSVLHALEVSGLPAQPFTFWGFLPRTSQRLVSLTERLGKGTHIFFESPRRLQKSLSLLTTRYPNSYFVVARELTKKYQEIGRFLGSEWMEREGTISYMGECILLVHIDQEVERGERDNWRFLARTLLREGVKTKVLAKLLGGILEESTKSIYKKLKDVDRQL